jgi:hypothetical protein
MFTNTNIKLAFKKPNFLMMHPMYKNGENDHIWSKNHRNNLVHLFICQKCLQVV